MFIREIFLNQALKLLEKKNEGNKNTEAKEMKINLMKEMLW